MFAVRVLTDGRPLLKTQSFRCFQAIQGKSKVVEARALRSALGVFAFACSHQSVRLASLSGGATRIRSQASVACQACLVCGHSSMRWCMVSGAWSQRRQHGWWGSRRRARQSAVQCLSRSAIQWKNFTRGGSQVFQISFQAYDVVDPWKVAL
jgi:hypothetical protein